MAKDRSYIITRSNYTLRDKHKQLKNGQSIYERDYMITTNLGGWDSGSIPNGEGNFKFVNNYKKNAQRLIKNGKWLCNENVPSGDCTVWTLNNIGNTLVKDESHVVPKPSTETLLDYVYFGSCTELIKSSITDIINKFPGELYVTEDVFGGSNSNVSDRVKIFNPFDIDTWRSVVPKQSKESPTYNVLRFFSESYFNYNIIDTSGVTTPIVSWKTQIRKKKCFNKNGEWAGEVNLNDNAFKIYVYYKNGEYRLYTDSENIGKHIRPNYQTVENFFTQDLDVFEKFLLNRETTPIYSMYIDSPRETNMGVLITKKTYTWPITNGWNLDLESLEYVKYINNLLDIAKFYDENNTDNLWCNITHEAIKNMDIPFSNPESDEGSDDYKIGYGNVHGLMLAYGRQFDDLKLAIDNIKSCNTITYNESNNVPDYFLSDTVQLSGWEVTDVTRNLDSNVLVDNLFSGVKRSYTAEDINPLFLRNLKINSRGIFSRKGTRYGIESLLSLFGLSSYEFGKNYYNCLPETYKISRGGMAQQWSDLTDDERLNYYDYKIDEYVAVAHNTSGDVVPIETQLFIEEVNSNIKEISDATSALPGLPVKMVYLTQEVDGESVTYKYLIPWFDKDSITYNENNEKVSTYDGQTYFQMYGGWFKTSGVTLGEEYDETLNYLRIVPTINDLSTLLTSDLHGEDIYYVSDISDFNDYYPEIPSGTASNYFYLNNINYPYQYVSSATTQGWETISSSDIENHENHGIQVVHLQNIIDTFYGNNPHVGYGQYDGGDKYIERLSHVFSGAIDDGLFDESIYTCDNGEIPSGITHAGFEVEKQIDNIKCWYFTDTTQDKTLYSLNRKYVEVSDTLGNEPYDIKDGYEADQNYQQDVHVGLEAVNNNEVFMDCEMVPWNMEWQTSGSTNDEAAANSIINLKNITITFIPKFDNEESNNEFKAFVNNTIFPYLKQVIPSTSIIEIMYS